MGEIVHSYGPYRLADLTWPEVEQRAGRGAVLVVAVGSTEQHGHHLPLSTDTDIAEALCERVAGGDHGVDVIIGPPIAYGSSGEHAGFAGTISIGHEALELMLVELGRSATETFSRVLLVSAHGGNSEAVRSAVERLRTESRDVQVFMPNWDGDAHAGHTETSVQRLLRPEAVKMGHAVAGNTRPLGELMPELRSGGVIAVSSSGVLGDPTAATARDGAAILDALSTQLCGELLGWQPLKGRV